jgi:hypothetical protein
VIDAKKQTRLVALLQDALEAVTTHARTRLAAQIFEELTGQTAVALGDVNRDRFVEGLERAASVVLERAISMFKAGDDVTAAALRRVSKDLSDLAAQHAVEAVRVP